MAKSSQALVPAGMDVEEESGQSLEIKGLLHVLLQRAWIIVLLAIIAAVATGAYVQGIPDRYRSTAIVEVEERERSVLNVGQPDPNAQNLSNPEVVETIIQEFSNRSLMERVSRALKLTEDAQFLGYTPTQPAPERLTVLRLLAGTRASLLPRTRLVQVSFTHRNPAVAQKVTAALVEQFVQQGIDQRIEDRKKQTAVLEAKAAELKANLEKSEQALTDYKQQLQQNNQESVSVEDRRNLVEEKLKALNGDFSAARAERLAIESDKRQVELAGDHPQQTAAIASIAQDPQVVAAKNDLAKAKSDLAALSQRYRAKHPSMIAQVAQVANAQRLLDDAIHSAPLRLDSRYKAAIAKEEGLQSAVKDQEKALLEVDKLMIPYNALKRDFDSNNALYQEVLQQMKAGIAMKDVQPVSFHLVEPALPAALVPDRRLLFIIAAGIGGGLLATAAIAAIFLLNSSIRTVDAAERLLGLPVLAAVPILGKSKAKANASTLALTDKADSPTSESFRTLRSAVSLLGPENDTRVLLFTSALPGEGKTFTAANTAVALAQQGLRTLIVDADLRRPALSRYFGVDENLSGLSDCMTGKPACVHPTKIENLFILPAGNRAPNPAELLSNKTFRELVEWMKRDFDRVVIDTAPVNVVSDTLNIVSCAPVVCLVIRSNSTSRKVVRRAIELLHRAGVRPDGVVLNYLPQWNGVGYYYHYASGSKYGNEETYGNSYDPTHAASRKPQMTLPAAAGAEVRSLNP